LTRPPETGYAVFREGQTASFADGIFSATSAVCVTGLTVTPDTIFDSGDKMLALGKNDEVLKKFR